MVAYGITPAYAGNTIFASPIASCLQDHPRIRGEYRLCCILGLNRQGSPPHTRGIPFAFSINSLRSGITPAYAGNTKGFSCATSTCWDHPRIRGEYPIFIQILMFLQGSPPHTRGIRIHILELLKAIGITPAYAGNTVTSDSLSQYPKDHPRIRGEYCCFCLHSNGLRGSPPHTRGIQTEYSENNKLHRITPAYAGNTYGEEIEILDS